MTVKILNQHQKSSIVALHGTGTSKAQLARLYKVSSDTITRVLAEVTQTAPAGSNPVLGPRVLKDTTATGLHDQVRKAIRDSVFFTIEIQTLNSDEFSEFEKIIWQDFASSPPGDLEDITNEMDDWLSDYDNNFVSEKEFREHEFGADDFGHEPIVKADEFAVSVDKEAEQETPKQELVWNASSKFISITRGRETFNADKDHPGFKTALQLLIDNKVEEALDIINIEQAVKKFVHGDIRIEDGALYFKDIELRTGLTQRIVTLMEEGKDFKFLIPFLENLLLNPSRTAVYRLFDFLEANDIEITADGHFIAWKKVRDNFKDIHSGTFDNSVGVTVEMMRNMVDEDDERTCSAGLHVCSKSYLGQFGSSVGNRVVSVKVHPRDVVSVPVDYGNAKMRTCKYVVQEDVTDKFY